MYIININPGMEDQHTGCRFPREPSNTDYTATATRFITPPAAAASTSSGTRHPEDHDIDHDDDHQQPPPRSRGWLRLGIGYDDDDDRRTSNISISCCPTGCDKPGDAAASSSGCIRPTLGLNLPDPAPAASSSGSRGPTRISAVEPLIIRRRPQISIPPASSPCGSTSSLFMRFPAPPDATSWMLHGAAPSTSSSSEARIFADRHRRPHAGIWFRLQASQSQRKQPFLPQVAKSYLRIKDGRMTVRLLMKYLVSKLSLDNESQVEVTCRGQQLGPSMTLQHVRDHIWRQHQIDTQEDHDQELVTLLPYLSSATTEHLMTLDYARSPSSK